MILACSFYSLKEVQGYKMLAHGVTLTGEEPRGLERALSGGDVVCTVEAWRRYFWHCCYMSRHVRHCWGSGFMSFGVVATCLVIPGPIAGVACLSL
jgi:hypothetical protein